MRDVHKDAGGKLTGRHLREAMLRQGVVLDQAMTSRAKSLLDLEVFGLHEDGFTGSADMMRRISDSNPGGPTCFWTRPSADGLGDDWRGVFMLLPFSIVSRSHHTHVMPILRCSLEASPLPCVLHTPLTSPQLQLPPII